MPLVGTPCFYLCPRNLIEVLYGYKESEKGFALPHGESGGGVEGFPTQQGVLQESCYAYKICVQETGHDTGAERADVAVH